MFSLLLLRALSFISVFTFSRDSLFGQFSKLTTLKPTKIINFSLFSTHERRNEYDFYWPTLISLTILWILHIFWSYLVRTKNEMATVLYYLLFSLDSPSFD